MKKGDSVYNTRTQKRIRVSRLVRMHADEMQVNFLLLAFTLRLVTNYCQCIQRIFVLVAFNSALLSGLHFQLAQIFCRICSIT